MELDEEYLSVKYTLRLKRDVDTSLSSSSSELPVRITAVAKKDQVIAPNAQQQKFTERQQSELQSSFLTSSVPPTYSNNSIASTYSESASGWPYESIVRETRSFDPCCEDDKQSSVWRSGMGSSLSSSESGGSMLKLNLKESNSDTSTPLDWMSPPSPDTQKVFLGLSRSPNKNPSTRYLLHILRSAASEPKLQAEKAQVAPTVHTEDRKTEKGEVAAVHANAPESERTAASSSSSSRPLVSQNCKLQPKSGGAVKAVKHATKLRAAIQQLNAALKLNTSREPQFPVTEIPVTERKIPIPKLERDMLQKSAQGSSGSELTMSTQIASGGSTSCGTSSAADSVPKSANEDEPVRSGSTKEQKRASTHSTSATTSVQSSFGVGASTSTGETSSVATASSSDSTSVSNYTDMRQAKGISKEFSRATGVTSDEQEDVRGEKVI
ncbi:unnamed protein product [Toxocara canis]|uniref:GPI-anchored adhesin-like protein PGA55 n=1 Tax=Toxocara canis TaxID=6265 RepID=A0A183V7S5_TOXCA|nr:unnamed protein product [Toxocara canis]